MSDPVPPDAGSENRPTQSRPAHTALKRSITPAFLLLFIVGDMIGGGIYALVGEVGAVTGGAIWTAFLAAMVLAVITAFSYAELVTKYPKAGGAAYYVHRAFKIPFVSFLVAFAIVMSGIASASGLAIAFGGYLVEPFFDTEVTLMQQVLVALPFMVVVALINFRGITESVTLNAIFTIIELGGLALIVIIAIVALGQGSAEPARAFTFKEGANVPMAIFAGAVMAFYALIGFEDSVNMAEETKNPSRSYPIALFGGVALAGCLYLLVTISAAMVVPIDQLAGSSVPLLEVVHVGPLGVPLMVFSIIALFALSNGSLLNMLMASRLVYGMSEAGVMPSALGKVHPRRRTPWVAIILTTLIALGLIATGDFGALASTTVLLLLLVFVMVNGAVLVLRREHVQHQHFRAPTILPILGVLVCGGMLTVKTVRDPEDWLRAAILLGVGILLYIVNVFAKRRLDRNAPSA